MRLKDLVTIIPADIETGIIYLHGGRKIIFSDILEVPAQYRMDTVETFDFGTNDDGSRTLKVKLVHS